MKEKQPMRTSSNLGVRKRKKRKSIKSSNLGESSKKALVQSEEEACSVGTAESATGRTRPIVVKRTIEEAMDVVERMVTDGLLVEGSTLWCFSVSTLINEKARSIFLDIPLDSGRLSWFEFLFKESNEGKEHFPYR